MGRGHHDEGGEQTEDRDAHGHDGRAVIPDEGGDFVAVAAVIEPADPGRIGDDDRGHHRREHAEEDQYQGDDFPCMPGEEPSADYPCKDEGPLACGEWDTYTYEVPRFDRVWWILAANPFVILADATPTTFDSNGCPVDLFGQIKAGVRGAQQVPETETTYDECSPPVSEQGKTPEEIIEESAPSWFVGLGLQVLLAAGLLWWAWARTRTPARTLPPGTRIA